MRHSDRDHRTSLIRMYNDSPKKPGLVSCRDQPSKVLVTLSIIARVLAIQLVLLLLVQLYGKRMLIWLYNWLLECPRGSDRCVLWWQRWEISEFLFWRFSTYIERKYYS
ncbi:LAMI_0D07602g1_1 [Lachancea mirantina]|uniref:LAMI_0D07602g1_1 n=1 Tax=Lachancea mirantina TaxID=1230905 RepID=A0A1G4JCE5_9SACH|nr:LAMI_0D07602g1_1 [Lachancea mirantina]